MSARFFLLKLQSGDLRVQLGFTLVGLIQDGCAFSSSSTISLVGPRLPSLKLGDELLLFSKPRRS